MRRGGRFWAAPTPRIRAPPPTPPWRGLSPARRRGPPPPASMAVFIAGLPQRRRTAGQVLSEFPKPVIAAVNGYAVGIGCIVTYCCDLIIASDRAEWRLPQVALGILPNHGGIVRLARWVGKGQAMKVAMGYPMKAEEALRYGLAQWLV